MNSKIKIDTETVLRELAGQYASGMMTTEEYLDTMEVICLRSANILTR